MRRLALILLVFGTCPAWAEAELDPGLHGDLNPPELSLNRVLRNVERGELDMATCATGYYITKSGAHEKARALFEACAAAGYTGAMTWMSQLDDNGLGAPEDPDAAAEWDRRAAMAGDPVGKFNYGLDLMRGRGVVQDVELGRKYVDEAAIGGLPVARRLQSAGYDLDEVTPDADNWKYAPSY
jgi:TPR repeat protein